MSSSANASVLARVSSCADADNLSSNMVSQAAVSPSARLGSGCDVGEPSSKPAKLNAPRVGPSLSRWFPSGRPQRNPVKPVPHRLLVADHLDGAKDPAAWTLVGIRAAEDLGMVRTGMTYDREYGTSATFYEKPGRTMFMEGPNEPAVGDHLEMNPRYLNFLFQPLDMTFRRADGRMIHKYPDVLIEFDDNTVRAGEIKSNQEWFDAPGVRRPLDRMDQAFAERGIDPMLRIRGEAFWRDDTVREAHELAMDARLTTFDPIGEANAIAAAIRTAGGRASYGALVALLGGERSHAVDKLYAMMLHRIVAFDLSAPPTAETPVMLPRPARAFALTELLTRCRREAA